MSIPVFLDNIKGRAGEHRKRLLFIGILVVVAISSFYMGYAARAEGHTESLVNIICPAEAYMDPVKLSDTTNSEKGQSMSVPASTGAYVASKNGKKYYPLACSGAKRIKDENKVYFQTKAEAESAGYSLGAGCTST